MSTPSNYHNITSTSHLTELLGQDLNRVSVLSFCASWAEPCKVMNDAVEKLAGNYPNVLVLSIDCDAHEEVVDNFGIESIPTVIFLKGHTLFPTRVIGADVAALQREIKNYAVGEPREEEKRVDTKEDLNTRLHALMNQQKVVLFMKGSPDAPQCGFSRQTVALLREQKIDFAHFDILTDEDVRQGLKGLNSWPTFPQLIINGELVGGFDIVKEMAESGELQEVVA